MINRNKFDLVYSLLNQYLFQTAKNNIGMIDHYLQTSCGYEGNPMLKDIVQAIKDYNFENIDEPLFRSIFLKNGKSDAESAKILQDIMKWKRFSKEQMEPAFKTIEDICANSVIQEAKNLYGDDPTEYVRYIKNKNIKSTKVDDVFSSIGFNEVDINSIVAETNDDFVQSRYDWINDSFDPFHGYARGQMVIICSPPGTGKSLWLMSEALTMAANGEKVLYVGLGDNNMKDFIVRMGAMYTGLSFADTQRNLGDVYRSLSEIIQNNLEISINPAGKVGAEEIVEYVKSNNYTVVMIDYDGNLKGVSEGESMYNTFGNVYETLNEIVLMGKLLFIASQPKVSAWGNSVIEMQDIGESSRKQHTADIIIGAGREVSSCNHLHTFKISKSRRGEEGVKAYTIRLNNGRFKEIPKGVYDNLKLEMEKRNYTEAEIDNMIVEYKISREKQGQIQQGNIGGVSQIQINSPELQNTGLTMNNQQLPPNPFQK